jgi:hypothetical protein
VDDYRVIRRARRKEQVPFPLFLYRACFESMKMQARNTFRMVVAFATEISNSASTLRNTELDRMRRVTPLLPQLQPTDIFLKQTFDSGRRPVRASVVRSRSCPDPIRHVQAAPSGDNSLPRPSWTALPASVPREC